MIDLISTAIPKVGKGAVCRNSGNEYVLETIEDLPVPTPAPGELLLKLNMTGLCMSDHHFMKGDWGAKIMCDCAGHEGAGVVVALGSAVDPQVWKVGDRAGIKPVLDVCHECRFCRGGRESLCTKAVSTGLMKNGSYAQYVTSPARYTSRIPQGLPDEFAGPIMCSGSTMYKAIKVSGIKVGEWLVLPGGGGGVGHMGICIGNALGIRVCVVDTSEEKKKMCLEMGAEAFVDFKTETDVPKKVQDVTGGGGEVVICTGSTAGAYEMAPKLLRRGGTMVCVGIPARGEAIAGMDPNDLIFKGHNMLSSLVSSHMDVDEVLDMAARGAIKPKVTVYPFKDFPKALELLTTGKVAGRAVINFNA